VIKDLYSRVCKDPRHHNIRTLAEGPIASRNFAQWSMAFGEVPTAEFQVLQQVAEYQSPAQMASQLAAGKVADERLLAKMKELVYTHAKG
jgi:hypothetical protein